MISVSVLDVSSEAGADDIRRDDPAAGDRVGIGTPAAHGVTVADIVRIYDRDQQDAGRLLEASQLSDS